MRRKSRLLEPLEEGLNLEHDGLPHAKLFPKRPDGTDTTPQPLTERCLGISMHLCAEQGIDRLKSWPPSDKKKTPKIAASLLLKALSTVGTQEFLLSSCRQSF